MSEVGPGEVTRAVLNEVCSILDRRTVSLQDDFFEIGGDSLDALELVERIEGRFGEISALSGVFSMRTIAEIVEVTMAATDVRR